MPKELNIKIGGEAGQGMVTIGELLTRAFVRSGLHVFATQDYMSRIRGGHNLFEIRVSEAPIRAKTEPVDILVALDKRTVEIHSSEVIQDGFILFDDKKTDFASQARLINIPFEKLAQEKGGKKIYANSVALGAIAGLMNRPDQQKGLDTDIIYALLKETFKKKEAGIIQGNIRAAQAGYEFIGEKNYRCERMGLKRDKQVAGQMVINGNEAIALGALASGVTFMSAYPMTPSTSIMVFLASKQEAFDLVVEQAEDEIAAINMAEGAAFAGARAMTATSGGGFSLMVEGLSLAGMTETPVVVVLAQRPGPATGLPTRTEQGDLLFATFAGHGEFARAIYAPGSAEEAFYLTNLAFNQAEKYQTPVIIMTDQYLADSHRNVGPFDLSKVHIERHSLDISKVSDRNIYQRHQLTTDGISPRAWPVPQGPLVVTDSDEHDEAGHITEDLNLRTKMVNKRLKKLAGLIHDWLEPEIYGNEKSELALVGWGSTKGVLNEVVERLNEAGISACHYHFLQVWPMNKQKVSKLLREKRIIVVENNATGQFALLLKAAAGLEAETKILKYNGQPFSPAEVINKLKKEVSM